jgi:hypothetical protein
MPSWCFQGVAASGVVTRGHLFSGVVEPSWRYFGGALTIFVTDLTCWRGGWEGLRTLVAIRSGRSEQVDLMSEARTHTRCGK